jgi:hypothetical protein
MKKVIDFIFAIYTIVAPMIFVLLVADQNPVGMMYLATPAVLYLVAEKLFWRNEDEL